MVCIILVWWSLHTITGYLVIKYLLSLMCDLVRFDLNQGIVKLLILAVVSCEQLLMSLECIHPSMHTHIYTHIHTHKHTHTQTHTHKHTYTHTMASYTRACGQHMPGLKVLAT